MADGRVTLVLGGARSGKSRHGEALVRAAGPAPWTYVATAEAWDAEMAERIAAHRADRGVGWSTIDAPHDLPEVVLREARGPAPVLVDCLTLWLSNRLIAEADLAAESEALVAAVAASVAPLVLVSNEVGLGIVPDNRLARAFRDAAGRLHQSIATVADRVVFMVAGLPLVVK